MIKKNRTKLIIAFVIGIALILLLGIFMTRGGGNNKEIESVTLDQDGNHLVVSRDGSVVYTNKKGVFFDTWDSDKTKAFFDYMDSKYSGDSQIVSAAQNSVTIVKGGQTYTYIVDDNDEIIAPATDDAQTPDSGSGGSSGNNSNNKTPTPAPKSTNSGGGGSSECLYWRLSYCVVAKTPLPTATPQAPTDPNANVIQAIDCADYLSGNQAPTIINNTVCLPEPTTAP